MSSNEAAPAPKDPTTSGGSATQAATGLAAAGAVKAVEAVATAAGSPVLGKAVGVTAGKVVNSRAGRQAVLAGVAAVVAVALGVLALVSSLLMPGAVLTAGASYDEEQAAAAPAGGVGVLDPCALNVASGTGSSLTAEQMSNAAAIVRVGQDKGVPSYGLVIAIATALQESGLRNLDYGDRDSLGLFQQRPSQGWGTAEQVRTPSYAAGKFFDALLAVPGWQDMAVTVAAQKVQRSGFPDAYAKHEPLARSLVEQLTGSAVEGGVGCAGEVGAGGWAYPVPRNARFTSGYGMRLNPVTHRWVMHDGIDLAIAPGNLVFAAAAGTVTHTGFDSAMGLFIWVDHGSGVRTRYQHLLSIGVAVGDRVSAGQAIGQVGNTGQSTGPHLHFCVYVNGHSTDPMPFLTNTGVS